MTAAAALIASRVECYRMPEGWHCDEHGTPHRTCREQVAALNRATKRNRGKP